MQSGELCSKNAKAFTGNSVGLTSIFRWERFDPLLLFKPGNRTVQSAGTEACSAKAGDIFHHGVTVFGAIGKACQDEERRVGILAQPVVVLFRGYYVSRTTHGVVISQQSDGHKDFFAALAVERAVAGEGVHQRSERYEQGSVEREDFGA